MKFLKYEMVAKSFVFQNDKVEYLRRSSICLNNKKYVYLLPSAHCCLQTLFDRYHVVLVAREFLLELGLEVHQENKDFDFSVNLQHFKSFAEWPVRLSLM